MEAGEGEFRCAAAAAAKSLQSCPTLCNPIDGSPPGSPVPGILQASNTGVGCHFLLQYMKVKSEREVTQSCPTLYNPTNCSLPGSSAHGIFQARVLEWGAIRCARISKYGGKLANALPSEGNDKAREKCQRNHSRALETDKKHRANE